MCNKLKLSKLRDVKTPTRTLLSAGTDFYVPKFNATFIARFKKKNKRSFDEDLIYLDAAEKRIIMAPSSQVLIPSGFMVNLDNFNDGQVQFKQTNRSSVAFNKQLIAGAATVDVDYTGEFHIHLINTGNRLIHIKEDDKIAQFEIIPVEFPDEIIIVNKNMLHTTESERGDKGFGSTGS